MNKWYEYLKDAIIQRFVYHLGAILGNIQKSPNPQCAFYSFLFLGQAPPSIFDISSPRATKSNMHVRLEVTQIHTHN